MATIFGLNAAGSGGGIMDYAKKTPAQIAAAAQTKAVTDKVKTLVAVTVDEKPAALPPGEVVKLTNDKGKVEYYVGTYDGKISKPLTSVSSAVNEVNTQIKKEEQVQKTELRTSQKIELNEIKETAKEAGLTTKEIAAIVKAETAANTAELKEFNSLLAEPMLQYGTRDPATNAFVASATPTPTPTSLLTYNDPVIAPTVQSNIASAREAVAEFQLLKGITEPFLPSGNTTSGVNTYAIYQALNNGAIIPTKDATGTTTGYTVSPEVAAAKGEQSGLIDATGMSKASSRSLGLILNNDAIIGGKANVVGDAQDNYYVNNASGADRYGTQKPLVDTGRTVQTGVDKDTGQPIYGKVFAEVSTDNSKRNYVSVVSNYIQQPDGSFTYGGVDSTDYTHVEGFNPIKALVIAGVSAGFGAGAGALSGLSGSAASAVGGAVGGATGAALSGSNILKGAALGGLAAFSISEIQAAAKAAGGYDKLLGEVANRNYSSFTQAGQDIAASAATSSVDGGTGGLLGGDNQASIDFGDGSVDLGGFTDAEIDYYNRTGGFDEAADYANSFNLDGTLKTIDLANSKYYTDGTLRVNENLNPNKIDSLIGKFLNTSNVDQNAIKMANEKSFIQDFIDKTYGDTTLPGINPDGTFKTIDLSDSTKYTDGTDRIVVPSTPVVPPPGGDTSIVPDILKPIIPYVAPVVIGGVAANVIKDALTPKPPAETVYTSPLLIPGKAPMTQVPTFAQNYNNLFNRQGVGAGQFLGYDYLNRINVPPELMGLLGTSAQAMPSMTPTV